MCVLMNKTNVCFDPLIVKYTLNRFYLSRSNNNLRELFSNQASNFQSPWSLGIKFSFCSKCILKVPLNIYQSIKIPVGQHCLHLCVSVNLWFSLLPFVISKMILYSKTATQSASSTMDKALKTKVCFNVWILHSFGHLMTSESNQWWNRESCCCGYVMCCLKWERSHVLSCAAEPRSFLRLEGCQAKHEIS